MPRRGRCDVTAGMLEGGGEGRGEAVGIQAPSLGGSAACCWPASAPGQKEHAFRGAGTQGLGPRVRASAHKRWAGVGGDI